MNLDQIVADYIGRFRLNARDEMNEFRKLSSLGLAIHHAAFCHSLPTTKRHPHQYRIPRTILHGVERRLQRLRTKISQSTSFEALHRMVDDAVGSMRGVGPLTVYDIAHRIGAFLGKKPKLVYLHRGTRVGAKRLGFTGDVLNPKILPKAFSRLTAAEIEDTLCIYKAKFVSGRSSKARRDSRGCLPIVSRPSCR
jgi:hypothetical protein